MGIKFFATIAVILACAYAGALAQDWTSEPGAITPSEHPPEEFLKLDQEVGELARQLGDWSGQYPLVENVLQNIWKDNGWNTEADLFARDTALEISKIPPWQFNQRMIRLTEAIDGRYQLNDQQRQQVRTMMYKESLHMMTRYGTTMLGSFRDMLQARLDGRPITPEQVARWEQAMDPLIDDLRKDIKRLQGEFGGLLGEDQKKILERDLQSANKRLGHYLTAREAWKRGEWQARDWGLAEDPIQMGRAGLDPAGAPTPARPVPSAAVPDGTARSHDETTWEAYVRAFVAYYQLDAAQEKKCFSILDGLAQQARNYRQRHKNELDKVSETSARSAQAYEPIRMLFLDLKNRMNPIPTDAQVRAAAARGPARLPEPAEAKPKTDQGKVTRPKMDKP